ncbi:SDR family oxidoreductase [Amycolatopsis ultiminotia]
MAGKVAIVTGSSRGIGRAIARRLGADGVRVLVNYHGERAAAESVVTAIRAGGGDALSVQGDVTDTGQVRSLFDTAEREFGGIDIVVSNVGKPWFSSIAEATDEDYERNFTMNTRTTFAVLRAAANRLNDGGRIVVVSSGVVATHRRGAGLYAASKAAGDELVRVLAGELGSRGITVNSVLPGATRTEALTASQLAEVLERLAAEVPLGRIGEPQDVADVVAFLAGHDGRWITGQALHAGGGVF